MRELVSVLQRTLVPAGLLVLIAGQVQANPFGSTVPAEPLPGFGLDSLVRWTAQAQGSFYQGLTNAMGEVATSPAALWSLLALSFAYGVAHAAGPGHGKMVIGSYMLASGETARRGALFALGAAFVQASMAVLLVGLLAGLFGLSRQHLNTATITLERFSYGLIILLGLYLLLRVAKRLIPARAEHAHPHHHHQHHHQHDDGCGCDHAHMPDASAVQATASWGQGIMLMLGAGARPCTGALLVLVLALSQGLFWQGAGAAYAMGAGTALTVALLAVLASGLSGVFSRAQASPRKGVIGSLLAGAPTVLGLVGSLLVLGMGALLLAASLAR